MKYRIIIETDFPLGDGKNTIKNNPHQIQHLLVITKSEEILEIL